MESNKRRFFPLEQEFRAIIYTAGNSVQLIGLSADGQSIWSFDAIDGILKLLHQNANCKFTSIQMKNDTELLIGTFKGEIITKSLLNDSTETRKYSEYPISSICTDLIHFLDSNGRLFSNEKIIFDDGIIQPCRILISSNNLFLVKHCSIYIFDPKTDEFITKLTLSQLICAAELDHIGNLVVCTDRGQLFTLDGSFKLKEIDGKNLIETQESESDGEEAEAEEDSDDSDAENLDKSEIVFSLIKNPNKSEILILKVGSIHKRAWIEEILVSCPEPSNNQITLTSPPFDTFNVICPLCNGKDQQQTLSLAVTSCLKGHPITICSQTGNLIITKCYKCRNCTCAFLKNPLKCPFCNGLITN